jgi:hypothetical protein
MFGGISKFIKDSLKMISDKDMVNFTLLSMALRN